MGFPIKKQNGGEVPKGGDQAAVYKNGKKIKQMDGQIYGAAKKGTKIDASNGRNNMDKYYEGNYCQKLNKKNQKINLKSETKTSFKIEILN